MGRTSGWARSGERLLEVRGEVSRGAEAARQQGKIGKGMDAVLCPERARRRSGACCLEGEGPARHPLQRSGARLGEGRPPARASRGREPGHPGLALEVRPPTRSAGRKARAVLDLEPPVDTPPIRRSASALRARGDGAGPVTSAALTLRWPSSSSTS